MLDYTIIIDSMGNKQWYFNNTLHRIEGPAIENVNGTKSWWLKGVQYSEIEHRKNLKLGRGGGCRGGSCY